MYDESEMLRTQQRLALRVELCLPKPLFASRAKRVGVSFGLQPGSDHRASSKHHTLFRRREKVKASRSSTTCGSLQAGLSSGESTPFRQGELLERGHSCVSRRELRPLGPSPWGRLLEELVRLDRVG